VTSPALRQVLDPEEFDQLTAPYRRELLAHCYRMVGSIFEAEDLVQETYLRAWRSWATFEGRSSVRTWLYRIATNVCLTDRTRSGVRALPSGLSEPSPHGSPLEPDRTEVAWLQPMIETDLGDQTADPARLAVARAGVRLALVATLQYLPVRQRAVFVLRDVLGWRAAEAADLMDITVSAANNLLRRARERVRAVAPQEDNIIEPEDLRSRQLVERYLRAFEQSDVDGLLSLLREDVTFEMPPIPTWFAGREAVLAFLSTRVLGSTGDWRLRPIIANGQPAVAVYHRTAAGAYEAEGIQVLTVAADGIRHIVVFRDPALFATGQLPMTMTA
jgi:RNA polymerase sigma-70 factor (ECF subfamily)